jgi:hypothetical protein
VNFFRMKDQNAKNSANTLCFVRLCGLRGVARSIERRGRLDLRWMVHDHGPRTTGWGSEGLVSRAHINCCLPVASTQKRGNGDCSRDPAAPGLICSFFVSIESSTTCDRDPVQPLFLISSLTRQHPFFVL